MCYSVICACVYPHVRMTFSVRVCESANVYECVISGCASGIHFERFCFVLNDTRLFINTLFSECNS